MLEQVSSPDTKLIFANLQALIFAVVSVSTKYINLCTTKIFHAYGNESALRY